MFNRIIFRCAAVVCAMSIGLGAVYAETREVEAEGEYRLGDNDTRAQAKELALDDAKKAAIEQVAVRIESYTLVNEFQLSKQQIASYTNGKLQIKRREFSFSDDGLVCKVHIWASVDIDEEELKNLPKIYPDDQTNQPTEQSSSKPTTQTSDPSELEPIPPWIKDQPSTPTKTLFNVEEYNGHYYAVIDNGMNWLDADEYCRKLGGHLATINSSAEQKFVQGIVFVQGKRNCYWLGGYQSLVKGDKWFWVDGTTFNYTNWAVDQPDNLKETALMMYRNPNPLSESALGEWNDLAENGTYESEPFFGLNNFGFVIEWESRDQVQYS